MIEFLTLSDDVMRASLLTLVYRASPPPKEPPSALTRSCVEAARMTMQRHHEFLVTFKDINPLYLSTYVHWCALSPSALANNAQHNHDMLISHLSTGL